MELIDGEFADVGSSDWMGMGEEVESGYVFVVQVPNCKAHGGNYDQSCRACVLRCFQVSFVPSLSDIYFDI